MKIVKLGQQGLKVPAVGLGCMGMSEFYGQSDDTKSLKLLDEALEIGCNFWDTADMYRRRGQACYFVTWTAMAWAR